MTHLKWIKNIFAILVILIVFASCKNNDKTETRDIQLLTDSTAYRNNMLSDTSTVTKSNVTPDKDKNKTTHKSSTQRHESPETVSSGNNTSNSGTTSSSGTTTTQGTEKKGWSKAAQGAVIGGAVGAVGGAIISKKKGTGAIIGAATGAAGGYIIGRSKDKKDGRVKK